jgi:Fe-S-cluster-containing dehydrogenase component
VSKESEIPWENVGPAFKKPRNQAAMLVDLNRCTGCHACSVSCKTEHAVPLGDFRIRVRYLERPESERTQLAFVPLLCMHCQDAPCLDACPTSAIDRLEDGRVVVDADRCCGNKACVAACPYGAIFINAFTQKADKCDFCTHRTEVGLDPACASACPTGALKFHDLGDENDPVTQMARKQNARAWKEGEQRRPCVLYVDHEEWMEDKVNLGVRLSPADEDPIYEQDNLGRRGA